MAKIPLILGLQGLELASTEKIFLKEKQPLGVILFKRNCQDQNQLKKLIASVRDILNTKNSPILIDQEGGSVSRLKEPSWPLFSAMGFFGNLYKADQKLAIELLKEQILLTATMLAELGINAVAAPCVDIFYPDKNKVIGDRAFSCDKNIVVKLAQVLIDEYNNHEIMPIAKHLPGHGLANSDSHKDLPYIDIDYQQLLDTELFPFLNIKNIPAFMTAHIVYKALDANSVLTHSSKALNRLKKLFSSEILYFSDCITMEALTGTLASRAKNSVLAGLDVVICSKATTDEYYEIADSIAINDKVKQFIWPQVKKINIDYTAAALDLNGRIAKIKSKLN